MRLLHIFVGTALALPTYALSAQIPIPGAEWMVWQQGINGDATWKLLGCPRLYKSDADKQAMIGAGACSNANPDGSIKDKSRKADESAEWQRLGCPRDYESDADKEAMIRAGQCRNAR